MMARSSASPVRPLLRLARRSTAERQRRCCLSSWAKIQAARISSTRASDASICLSTAASMSATVWALVSSSSIAFHE
jgi:hypothetical protein